VKRSLLTFFILLLCQWVFVRSGLSAESAEGKVLRVSDGQIITFSGMIADVKTVDFVFIGEVHDISEHHRGQLAVIRAFHESDEPTAVGLEMFRADSQGVLDSWVRGKLSVEQFLPAYYDNWREPWPLYRDIFQYARDHEIPLLGLNVPDKIAEKVAHAGFASLTPAERRQLPPGISCNVDPTYMEFIRRAYAGHAAHDRGFVNFCEAQMVWDKSMAWHLIAYVKKKPGRTVVVLAGIGHAWKRGIPGQMAADSKYTYRVVLPFIPDQIDRETVTTKDADYVLLDE
jgi:uncharacterized iron-regulated protein